MDSTAYNTVLNNLHILIAKHIVRSHKPTLRPKPAKEFACFAYPDFTDTNKTKSLCDTLADRKKE